MEAGYKEQIFKPQLNFIPELIEKEKKISLHD